MNSAFERVLPGWGWTTRLPISTCPLELVSSKSEQALTSASNARPYSSSGKNTDCFVYSPVVKCCGASFVNMMALLSNICGSDLLQLLLVTCGMT